MWWPPGHRPPDIETIDTRLEELRPESSSSGRRRDKHHPRPRGPGAPFAAHAKALGVAEADVEILDGLSEPYAQGVYAKPGHHGSLIRFSRASNHLGPDMLLRPVLGFAIKIFDVDEPSWSTTSPRPSISS